MHDCEVLLRQPDQDMLLSREHLPLYHLSGHQLPLPCTNFYKVLKPKRRGNGWQDADFLLGLHEDVKKQINDQQKQLGIKVTAFDEL